MLARRGDSSRNSLRRWARTRRTAHARPRESRLRCGHAAAPHRPPQAGQWFARQVSTRLDPTLCRATGGRFTTSMGVVVNDAGYDRRQVGSAEGSPADLLPWRPRIAADSPDLRSPGRDGRDRVAVVVGGTEPAADERRAGVTGYLPKIRLTTPQKPPPPEPCGSGASPSVPAGCGPAALVVGLSRRGGAYTRS